MCVKELKELTLGDIQRLFWYFEVPPKDTEFFDLVFMQGVVLVVLLGLFHQISEVSYHLLKDIPQVEVVALLVHIVLLLDANPDLVKDVVEDLLDLVVEIGPFFQSPSLLLLLKLQDLLASALRHPLTVEIGRFVPIALLDHLFPPLTGPGPDSLYITKGF